MDTNNFSTLSRAKGSIPTPELELSGECVLFNNIVKKFGRGNGIIKSYNHWVDEILPKQFFNGRYPKGSSIYIIFKEIKVERPIVKNLNSENGKSVPMLPKYARDHSRPYSGEITGVPFKITENDDNTVTEERLIKGRHSLGYIPIMLGSDYCWLSDLTDEEKIKVGESPDDPLGYFIIDGSERIINIQEKLRTHVNHTFVDPKGRIETRMTCVKNFQSTITKIVVGKKWQSLKVSLSHLNNSSNPKHYPVFLVYIMLKIEEEPFRRLVESNGFNNSLYKETMIQYCDEFTDMIISFCKEENEGMIRDALQSSADKALRNIVNIVPYMAKKMDRYATGIVKKDPYKYYGVIRQAIIKDLYMHVPEGFKRRELAFSVSNSIRYVLGLRPADSRDSWSNKRLEVASKSMEKLVTVIINNIYKTKDTKNRFDYKDIEFKNITDTFKTSFRSNKWGYKEDNHKENITDILKRENSIAVLSQIGKVNTPSSRQSRQTSIRMVQDQLGVICISETPEGENLGLLKNVAISSYNSDDRSDTHILNYMDNNCECFNNHSVQECQPCRWTPNCNCGQNHTPGEIISPECNWQMSCNMGRHGTEEQCNQSACEYLPNRGNMSVKCSVGHIEGGIPFMINGVIYYWLAPPGDNEDYGTDILGRKKTYVEDFLIKARRAGKIPYDSCITFNHTDNILEYFSDSSRPLRPLLIVTPEGELAADVFARNNPHINVWETEIDVLLKNGIIEMIDVREQEYIMLAMKPEMVRQRNEKKKFLTNVLKTYNKGFNERIQKFQGMLNEVMSDDNFKKLLLEYGFKLFTYYYGLVAIKKINLIDMEEFGQGLFNVIYEYYSSYVFEIFKAHHENDGDFTTLHSHSDTSTRKKIMDIIDESQRKYSVDSTKLPKPRLENYTYSSQFLSYREKIAQSISVEDISRHVFESYSEDLEKLNKALPFTHSEIDPVAMFGISASLQPFPNSSQGPRSTYQASMCKQSLGSRINHHTDFSKAFKIMENPTRPTFETSTAELLGINTSPTGTTANCAFLAVKNNNEDAIGVSRNFIKTNKMDLVKYTTYREIIPIGSVGGWKYSLSKPQLRSNEPAAKYDHIDKYGVPALETYVRPRDCIIGIQKTRRLSNGTEEVVNVSAFVNIGEEGFVDRIIILKDRIKGIIVKVKIRRRSKQRSGDKIASRFAQKGTFSTIYDSHDMPCVVGGPNDGVIPDFLLNPHSIPSRMSANKLKEMLACKASLWTGERVDCTAFHDYDFDKYARVLEENGMEKNGTETMMWSNGRIIKGVTLSPCYYQCLRHHVADHIQMRARGAVVPIVRQPVSGRSNQGGLRIGEMERDGLISHGATGLVLERLMIVSDAYDIAFCKTCGNIAIPNVNNTDENKSSFECRVCESRKFMLEKKYHSLNNVPKDIVIPEPEFVTKVIPYVLKVIFHMLNGMGINTTLKFRKNNLRNIHSGEMEAIPEEYSKYISQLQ